jgi:hypothetical protein
MYVIWFLSFIFLSSNPYITPSNNMIKYKVPLSLSEIEKKDSNHLNHYSFVYTFLRFFWHRNKRNVYEKCSLSLTRTIYMHGTNFTQQKKFFSSPDISTNKQYNMLTICSSCGLLTPSHQHRSGTIVWKEKEFFFS